MTHKITFVTLLLSVFYFSSCSHTDQKEKKPDSDASRKVSMDQEEMESEEEPDLSYKDKYMDEEQEAHEDYIFGAYAVIKKKVKEWNDAINSNHLGELNAIYADKVLYYLETQPKHQCIENKSKWLSGHLGYTQKIKGLDIYHYYNLPDTTVLTFVVNFDKVCTYKDKTDTIPSIIHFTRFNNEWKIIRETDRVSEVKRARKAPVSTLKKGDYIFVWEYWQDCRAANLVDNMRPYRSTIYLNVDDKITGEYDFYSGPSKIRTAYGISGKIENGILKVKALYYDYMFGEPGCRRYLFGRQEFSARKKGKVS